MDPQFRIGSNADPVPAFYPNADPGLGSQTNADPDPGRTTKSQKVEIFLHKKIYLQLVITHTNAYEGTKAFLKGRKPSYLPIFFSFDAPGSGFGFPIQIRIEINADQDSQHWAQHR
jgi:hypothetical protein